MWNRWRHEQTQCFQPIPLDAHTGHRAVMPYMVIFCKFLEGYFLTPGEIWEVKRVTGSAHRELKYQIVTSVQKQLPATVSDCLVGHSNYGLLCWCPVSVTTSVYVCPALKQHMVEYERQNYFPSNSIESNTASSVGLSPAVCHLQSTTTA